MTDKQCIYYMATAQGQEEILKCPICSEQFNKLRKLPECCHTFCETCLLTCISNLESVDGKRSDLQCPVCKKQICAPVDNSGYLDWLKSLEIIQMASDMRPEEENEKDKCCVSCKEIDKAVSAEIYCIDCQDSLCKSCSRIRHGTKLLKTHSVFELQERTDHGEGEKLVQILSKYLTCSRHSDKALSLFCKEDDALCCVDCVLNDHRHCDCVINVRNQINKQDNEAAIMKIKQKIDNTAAQVRVLTDHKKKNISDIKAKADMMSTQIGELRTKVNGIIDILEENICSTVKSFTKACSLETEDEKEQLKEINTNLTEISSLINYTQTKMSKSQLFIILKVFTSKLETIDSKLFEIGQNCKEYEINLKTERILQELMNLSPNNTDQLASVSNNCRKVDSLFAPKADMLKNRCVKKTAKYEILPKECQTEEPEYYGIIFLGKAQEIFLVDTYSGFCCVTDENYEATVSCTKEVLSGKPYSATHLKQGIVAVSIPEQKKICFLSTQDKTDCLKITGIFRTKFTPKALCGLRNGDIAVSWQDPVAFGIYRFTCSTFVSCSTEKVYYDRDAEGRELKTFDFMAIDETRSHIIQPCSSDKTVYCFDFQGNPKFAYNSNVGLPRGVACDADGNVYVCDKDRACIHIISHAGLGIRVIVDGCPKAPLAVAFDASGTQFAVTRESDPWKDVAFFNLLQS